MSDEHEFGKRADTFMAELLDALDELDPDDLDCHLSMGVLSMEFADGTKCIMNRQVPARQIWLAHGATAWHFEFDPETDTWVDTKGRGDIKTQLAKTLGTKLGRELEL